MNCQQCKKTIDDQERDHIVPNSSDRGYARYCSACCPITLDNWYCTFEHPKRYLVKWRSPGLMGSGNVACMDFRELGIKILEHIFPPAGCPMIITSIELIDPDQYFDTPISEPEDMYPPGYAPGAFF